MQNKELHIQMINATKWASITEIIAKLIVPITNMVLARLLTPEAFGVVATITMIISFADMLTDTGFQKYIIQHEFKTEKYRNECTNVAFYTNLAISILMWIIIMIFSQRIAEILGNPELGRVISIACLQLPITSFSSIQISIYKRNFDFKTLFLVKIIGICLPFVITIPLAILGFSYWSIIIGNLIGNLFNALILTLKSTWKPSVFYSIKLLKEMMSFGVWSLIEGISVWLSSWIDTFLLGSKLNAYYLGVYKTSLSTVNALMAIITGSITPVLFSGLSRLQNDKNEFEKLYFNMQKLVAFLILPMGVGVYLYRDLITKILLGNQWKDASEIIGIWALINTIKIVLGNNCSELYRAKGKPKISFGVQLIFLIIFIPICIISSKYGFRALVYATTIGRLIIVIIHNITMKIVFELKFIRSLDNLRIPVICTIIMGIGGIWLKSINTSLVWNIFSIIICVVIYLISVSIIDRESIRKFYLMLSGNKYS